MGLNQGPLPWVTSPAIFTYVSFILIWRQSLTKVVPEGLKLVILLPQPSKRRPQNIKVGGILIALSKLVPSFQGSWSLNIKNLTQTHCEGGVLTNANRMLNFPSQLLKTVIIVKLNTNILKCKNNKHPALISSYHRAPESHLKKEYS